MNKLLTKIVGVALGATMAVGVGLAAAKGVESGLKPAYAADTWVETAPTSLATNDVVAIVDKTTSKAMSNNNGTSSAPSATEVTLNSGKTEITSSVAATIQWVVTKDGGNYSFGVTGTSNYLYCTAANNGVRVGTNDNRVFTMYDNNGVDFLVNSGTTRYIGVYNSQDWRCYTSINNNIKDTVVTFYKKVSGSGDATLSVTPASALLTLNETETFTATTTGGSGDISWVSDDADVATVSPSTGSSATVTAKGRGTATITVSYSTANNVEIPITVANVQHAGTEGDPYTVEDAIDSIRLQTGLSNVYASGIVSKIVTGYSSQYNNITFDISTDGTTSGEQLRGYKTVGTTEYPIDSTDSVKVGDIVTLYGTLTEYGGIYEFGAGNELVYLERPVPPSITIDQGGQYLEIGDDIQLTATTTGAEGITVVWTSDASAVASVDSTGLVSALTEGSATITATITVKGVDYTDSITVTVSVPQTPVIEVGDQILIFYDTHFLTGVSGSIGTQGDESDAMVLDVYAGSSNKTFAFKNGDVYLSWTSGNSLTTSSTIDANSSWTAFGESKTDMQIVNVADSTRRLQYNNGSPRFACYTGSQQDVSVKIYNPGTVKELSSLRVEGTPEKTVYNAGESFVSTGLTVYAVFTDSTTYPDEIVTSSIVWGSLVAGETSVTGTYTLGAVTKSCTITGLTINAYVAPTYTLITDASQLKVGDSVAIVASDADYAMSTTQNSNNRGQASITKDSVNNTATLTADVQIFTVEAGTVSNSFAFNTGEGYIYAASSTKNYLRTEAEKSDNSSFTFAITEGNAILTAQGANTRNVIQYNSDNSMFACYGSASQGGVQIYRDASQPEPTPVDEFVAEFLGSLSTGTGAVCDAQGNTDLDELKETWALLALEFDDLDPTDKALFVDGEASESGTDFQKALALYDYIAAKYNTSLEGPDLDDYNFMGRSITPSGNNRINPMNTANSTVAIIVVATISVISVSALGAYFLLRKKKEER